MEQTQFTLHLLLLDYSSCHLSLLLKSELLHFSTKDYSRQDCNVLCTSYFVYISGMAQIAAMSSRQLSDKGSTFWSQEQ